MRYCWFTAVTGYHVRPNSSCPNATLCNIGIIMYSATTLSFLGTTTNLILLLKYWRSQLLLLRSKLFVFPIKCHLVFLASQQCFDFVYLLLPSVSSMKIRSLTISPVNLFCISHMMRESHLVIR